MLPRCRFGFRGFIQPSGAGRVLPLLVAMLGVALAGCASHHGRPLGSPTAPLRGVQQVDLRRFMGDWRVIAQISDPSTRDTVDSIESLALRPDGRVQHWSTFRRKSFAAPQQTREEMAGIVNTSSNAEWRLKLPGLKAANYSVIDLDPEYQWAVMGHASRERGWIMAREKSLPDWLSETLLDRLAVQGFDPARFVKVPQFPHQLPAAP